VIPASPALGVGTLSNVKAESSSRRSSGSKTAACLRLRVDRAARRGGVDAMSGSLPAFGLVHVHNRDSQRGWPKYTPHFATRRESSSRAPGRGDEKKTRRR